MSLAILGLGTALPANAVPQPRALDVMKVLCCHDEEQRTALPGLFRHAGIDARHFAVGADVFDDILRGTRTTDSIFLPSGTDDDPGPTTGQRMEFYSREALPLALEASGRALRESGLAPRDLTHLVTVSCTGFAAPGVDVGLIKGLGLAPTVQRTHVGFMGCHGAVNGLRVARAYADSPEQAQVLVCAVELCSIHFEYTWNPKKVVANSLFADGSAAVVGVPAARAPAGAWQVAGAGSCLVPDTEYAMGWTVGDHGFDMTLSTRIPALIAESLRPWLTGWLAQQGLTVEAVGSWAVHPGGPRVLSAVEESLGLPAGSVAVSREVLAECGNMSSPSVLFILERLRRRGAARPCVVLGFGPGLVAEAVLVR